MINKFTLTLQQLRKTQGLTQQQVADALGIERSTYAYYETGKANPGCAFIIRLSKIFNVDYRVFMEAIADENLEEDFNTVNDSTWEERERLSRITKSEQEFIIVYRLLDKEKKNEFINYAYSLKDVLYPEPNQKLK